MIKAFFITFFILEFIVALAIIIKLHKIDKKIIQLEKIIRDKQNELRSFFFEIKSALINSNNTINTVKQTLKKKKEEILLGIGRQLAIIVGMLLLKDKYKKKFLIINIVFDVFSAIRDEIEAGFA